MALSIDKVHDRVNYLIKKNKWAYASPQEIDLALDMAQLDLFSYYYGDPSKYKYGRPIPPVAHGQNQKLHDSLSPFLKPWTLDGANGFNELPSDYVHLDSAYLIDYSTTPDTYIPLKLVSNDKVAFRSNSQMMPVKDTSDFSHAFISLTPDFSTGTNGLQLYPRESPAPLIPIAYYLSRPTAPVYSYTQSGRTITYVEASSVDLLWSDDDINNQIIPRAMQYIGINLEDNNLFQAGQIKAQD